MKTVIDKWKFSFNNGSLEDVTVPHDWAIKRPFNPQMDCAGEQGFFDRWGVGEYTTNVNIIKAEGSRYFLEFDGVYENSVVYVNKVVAGENKYGYSGFSLEVTSLLNSGDNEIYVRVDNTTRPVDRWYSGCGIYRKVCLKEVPLKYIDRNNVVIVTDTKGNVSVDTGLDDAVSVQLTVGETVYKVQGKGTVSFSVSGFQCWTAQTPALYTLEITLEESGHKEAFNIGFREVLFNDKGFFINGKNEKLQGVCVHQDISCFGSATPACIWRERFLVFKEYGVNAIRLAHHLFMPEILDLCDELGFYVYEESFDKWKSGLYERYYDENWQRDIETMVKRDRNRPSVVIWGVGNEVENQTSEQSLECLADHCRFVKSLDSTRPVTFAIFPWFWRDCDISDAEAEDVIEMYGEDNQDIAYRVKYIKRMAESVDIISCNYQEPWYENYHKAVPDKAILGTEIYQYFRGYPRNVNSYEDSIPWLDAECNDYVAGGFVWAGTDYLGESMGWPAKGWGGALFATDMEPKAGAYIHRSYWDTKPFVYFAVMDYSVADEFVKEQWDMPRYVSHWDFHAVNRSVIPFMIASNCDEVILKLNDKILVRKKPDDCKNRVVAGFIPYVRGTVEVVGLKDGMEVCTHRVATPDKAEKLEFDCCEKDFDADVIMLKVRAKDGQGNVCFKEKATVSFSVEGDAYIIGVDNGDLLSHTPYHETTVDLYRGRASVAVKLWGKAKLTAYAEGLMSAQISLN